MRKLTFGSALLLVNAFLIGAQTTVALSAQAPASTSAVSPTRGAFAHRDWEQRPVELADSPLEAISREALLFAGQLQQVIAARLKDARPREKFT